jgi:3-phenylpropionate/trans-cinnamate dioxygenase ferredoxin subunit
MAERERERVAIPKSQLPHGERTTITVRRREIALFNVDGRIYALFNRCPHQQAPLAAGRIAGTSDPVPVGEFSYNPEKRVVRCPWHHYEFDLDKGHCLADPGRFRIATYEVREEGDEIAVYV